MKGTIELVRLLISAQMLTTVFLAVLLCALHVQLRRQEFNRWWVGAWSMSALFLTVGRLSMAFPAGWSVTKGLLVLIATLFGFLVAPALVFGAVSLESPGKITRRIALGWCASALAFATVSFGSSLPWSGEPLTAFSIRNGPRTLVLGAALFYCARVFIRRVRVMRSWAALLTGVCCLIYALNQCVYTVAQIAQITGSARGAPQGVGRTALLWSARLLYADVVVTCGIALGMVLLLVEEYQRSERALFETTRTKHEVAEQNELLQAEIRSRHEVEARLRESEDRYRDLVDNSEDLLCTHDLDGRILSCNPAAARMLGYDVDELLKIPARDLLAPDVRGSFDEYVRLIRRTGVAEGVVKVITRGGERRLWSFRNTLRTDGVAQPIVRGMGRDVTEQFRAERARKEVLARHEAILRALPDWVFLTTGDGLLLDCWAKDTRYLLMPPSEFIGKHVLDVLPPDLALKLVNCYHEALESDQPATLEYSIPIDDELRYYEVRSVRADQGQVLSLVRDVSDQKRAEQRVRDLQEELAHASRVNAIGALTGSLAHEINQPLTAIQTNAFVALKMLEAQKLNVAAVKDALGDIVADNRRIDDVLRRLRGLLRKERRDHAPVDVNAIISDVLMLARSNFIERRIAVEIHLASHVPAVLGDRVQLQQVVLNLLMNAADAVSSAHTDDRSITVATSASGAQVTVSVADRGVGVSDAALGQIFEPFFTTKAEGMGLGLSICRAIIDAHGGEISAKRNFDQGLTCWFTLSAAAAIADAEDIGAPASSVIGMHVRETSVVNRLDA
jgi:PAS domain S-box-containing protein